MMKGIFISDIRDNQPVRGLFLVKSASLGETRTGNPFLALVVMDRSGEISGRVWDNAEEFKARCRPGKIISLTATAQSYRGSLQLKVTKLEEAEVPDEDRSLFLPSTPGDIPEMAAALKDIAHKVSDPDYNRLLAAFLDDREIFRLLQEAPAAKGMHHAYFGGLLEHVLGVTRLAEAVAGLYPGLDRSLLITGAILHDIGKLTEFSFAEYPIEYSDKGRLMGHMVIAIELIHEKTRKLADFPDDKATRLKHLILSHHGRHEFGSPTLPMMIEAFALNFIDDLDAKINYMERLARRQEGSGYQWTDFQRNMERFLLVRAGDPPKEPEQEAKPQAAKIQSSRQKSLWGA